MNPMACDAMEREIERLEAAVAARDVALSQANAKVVEAVTGQHRAEAALHAAEREIERLTMIIGRLTARLEAPSASNGAAHP